MLPACAALKAAAKGILGNLKAQLRLRCGSIVLQRSIRYWITRKALLCCCVYQSLLQPLLQQKNMLSSVGEQKAYQKAAAATKRKGPTSEQKAAEATKRKARNASVDTETLSQKAASCESHDEVSSSDDENCFRVNGEEANAEEDDSSDEENCYHRAPVVGSSTSGPSFSEVPDYSQVPFFFFNLFTVSVYEFRACTVFRWRPTLQGLQL